MVPCSVIKKGKESAREIYNFLHFLMVHSVGGGECNSKFTNI